jgi:hypothetical protein
LWLPVDGVVQPDRHPGRCPEVYEQTLRVATGDRGSRVDLLFLDGLPALIALIGVGVLRRWRWIFWLPLLAFFSSWQCVPAWMMGLAGVAPRDEWRTSRASAVYDVPSPGGLLLGAALAVEDRVDQAIPPFDP